MTPSANPRIARLQLTKYALTARSAPSIPGKTRAMAWCWATGFLPPSPPCLLQFQPQLVAKAMAHDEYLREKLALYERCKGNSAPSTSAPQCRPLLFQPLRPANNEP